MTKPDQNKNSLGGVTLKHCI